MILQMQNYWQHIRLFAKRILVLLFLYSISRIFFYLVNAEYFNEISFFRLLGIFIAGIRFDIAAIAFTNVIFILLLIPGNFRDRPAFQKTGDIVFYTLNGICLLGNFIDARFFDFINKRSTSAIFSLMGTNKDVWLLIPQFIVDYWYVVLCYVIIMVFFWLRMPRLPFGKLAVHKMSFQTFNLQLIVLAIIAGLFLLGARGTGLKPIGIINATHYVELKYVPLVINTPFSIIKTVENENLDEKKYFDHDSLGKIYDPVHQFSTSRGSNYKNVVILILESFSKEYSGYLSGNEGFTPHLDSILAHSLVFENAYANGTQSYEAMPAIISGIPSLMERPYSGSNYADNMIESLPFLLSKEGYQTSFFHGGNNGTMGFNRFANASGIEKYFGRNEYNNDLDYDGSWGIWDEPFLQYFINHLNSSEEPFFASVFTLSSHHPYKVPDKYKDKFREGDLPILQSIGYADYALGQFFKHASSSEWFKNTLFVIMADHAAQAIDKAFNSTTGMYAIPLAFFSPSDTLLHGIDSSVAQQADIMPTVLNYLGYHKPFFAFGESLLDKDANHFAVSYLSGVYQLIEGDYVMLFDGNKVTSFYKKNTTGNRKDNNDRDITLSQPERLIYKSMEARIKAIIQTYNDCMINNRLTFQSFREENK
jgi:phosphoglycerol transferase MdoB-like AlkP superfamily enzyme